MTQSKKFDPSGEYIKRWLPELSGLSATEVHEPWRYPSDYPEPLVDLKQARLDALERYSVLKSGLKAGEKT